MNDESDKKSRLEVIMDMLYVEDLALFRDQLHEAYVAIGDDGATVMRVDSSDFREWLYNFIWERSRKPAGGELIHTILQILRHQALSNPTVELGVRVASEDGVIFYDTGKNATVKIGLDGWEKIYKSLPIVFKRFDHQEQQVLPESHQKANLDELLELFNVRDEQERLLLKIYIVAAFIPDFPHPVLVVHGSQGSAKSTLCRLIKSLIDPSRADSLCITDDRDITQLVQTASHHWVLVLDNISYLSERISDTISRICTGGALSKRRLYTNSEDYIFNVRHLVILNGVNQVINKPDLLDRSILIGLDRIPDERRMTERDVYERFGTLKPKVLGGIFDVLSRAMNEYPSIQQEDLPRMADFARWGCAIAKALGYKADDFVRAYKANVGKQNQEAIGASSVATVIVEYMQDKDSVELSPSELLSELEVVAERLKLKDSRDFPPTASWLSRRIVGVIPNLAALGIKAEQDKDKKRKIRLTKIAAKDSIDGTENMPVAFKAFPATEKDNKDGIDTIFPLQEIGGEGGAEEF